MFTNRIITNKFFNKSDILIILLLILLVIFRYYSTRPTYHVGDTVRITSVVLHDPINYETSQYLRLAGLKIYLPKFPEISYGDKVVIEGTIGGDVHGNPDKLEKPKLVKIEDSVSMLSGIRNSIIAFYQTTLPEPESGLLAGIVLGAKGALSQDFYDQTKLVGVAHVVVASGTNITFVVAFLMGVLTLFLSRRKAIVFVILGSILYLFISGFDAPLVRAFIMSSFIFLGQESGRLVSTWRIFFLTALLMLVYDPSWAFDIGFILSFVSTASLMLFEKRVRLRLRKIPEILKEGLSTSLAAQIGVTPILFVTFGQFNLLSPIVNALVLPVVPLLMILGAMGGVIGLLIPFLGKLILYLAYPMLWWFVGVVKFFS